MILDLDLRPWLSANTPPDWLEDEDRDEEEEEDEDEALGRVSALALDAAGQHLALGFRGFLPRIQLLSPTTGEPTLPLKMEEGEDTFFAFHDAVHVSFSPDGRYALAQTMNVDNGNTIASQLWVFDVATGALTHQVSPDADAIASTGIGVACAAWHGDQVLIAHLQREIELCGSDGSRIHTYVERDDGGDWYIGSIAIDAAGSMLVWHDHREVVLWRRGAVGVVPLPEGWCDEYSVSAASISEEGVFLAVVSEKNGGRLLKVTDQVEELALLPDARRVVALDAARRQALFLDEGSTLLQPTWGDVRGAVFPLPMSDVRATAVGGGRLAITDGSRVVVMTDPRSPHE